MEKRPLLEVRNLTVYYGTVRALNNVSFAVGEGELVCMIGPNGAGKSTALKAVAGLVRPKSGEILYDRNSISGLHPEGLVRLGMSIVPEGRRVFPSMTVLENLEMGAYARHDVHRVCQDIEEILELFPSLKDRRRQKAGTLSTGEQQMLAFGRALMSKPKLLLADEPSDGLSPYYIDVISEKLKEINGKGTGILLVEQNARMALEICHRGYVFKIGEIMMEGEGKELLSNPEIRKVFL
ncbi:MAG: ABC transporter ATP-binding protein [Candidatus Brocadiaceae bacterium]|nr:ABC transporter ATP-binding protein [Candidatus Brocadiaceae bacterium]